MTRHYELLNPNSDSKSVLEARDSSSFGNAQGWRKEQAMNEECSNLDVAKQYQSIEAMDCGGASCHSAIK